MFYVYLLKSKEQSFLYVGCTKDLKKRFDEHNAGKSFATKPYKPFELIYYEAFKVLKDAQGREKSLKQYGQGLRRLKERLKYGLSDY